MNKDELPKCPYCNEPLSVLEAKESAVITTLMNDEGDYEHYETEEHGRENGVATNAAS
jgi:hypothetical protein